MNLELVYDVLDDDGTAALEVDGVRVVYIKAVSGVDRVVDITVLAYNEFGLTPIRQPRYRSHVGGALRRLGMKRRTKKELQAEGAA